MTKKYFLHRALLFLYKTVFSLQQMKQWTS